MRAQPAQQLELTGPCRADQQPTAERQPTRHHGPLQLAHRAERRADPLQQPSALGAPLGALNRLAQPAARERECELVVLGELSSDGHEQLGGQIE
jgi:hypothetical protein